MVFLHMETNMPQEDSNKGKLCGSFVSVIQRVVAQEVVSILVKSKFYLLSNFGGP